MSLLIYKAGYRGIRSFPNANKTRETGSLSLLPNGSARGRARTSHRESGMSTINSVEHDALKTNPEFPMLEADYQIFPEKLTVV